MTREFILTNLNLEIRFKPNDKAREIHLNKHEEFIRENPNMKALYCPMKEDKEGFVTMQLWCFMEMFGAHMYLGMTHQIADANVYIQRWEV